MKASWDLLLKKQVVWEELCRVASAMITDRDVIGPVAAGGRSSPVMTRTTHHLLYSCAPSSVQQVSNVQ